MINFSFYKFPKTKELAKQSRLPFSLITQPFLRVPDFGQEPTRFVQPQHVLRCQSCFAFINKYCRLLAIHKKPATPSSSTAPLVMNADLESGQQKGELLSHVWVCSLCHKENKVGQQKISKQVQALLESGANIFDIVRPEPKTDHVHPCKLSMCIALVDLSDTSKIELLQRALQAALEALSDGCLFALLGFNTQKRYCTIFQFAHTRGGLVVPVCKHFSLDDIELGRVLLTQFFPTLALGTLDDPTRELIELSIDALGELAATPCLSSEKTNQVFLSLASLLLERIHIFQTSTATTHMIHVMTFLASSVVTRHHLYHSLANQASENGVTWDIFDLLSTSQEHLSSTDKHQFLVGGSNSNTSTSRIDTLCQLTGGEIVRYPHSADNLPQDVFKRLLVPKARHCLVRVRTNPQLQVGSEFGPINKDPNVDDLFFVSSMNENTSFGFEISFRQRGFPVNQSNTTLQVAFAYTRPVLQEGKLITMQFSRVITVRVPLVTQLSALYDDLDIHCVTATLCFRHLPHADKNLKNSALLSWLANLMAHYNTLTTSQPFHPRSTVDLSFSKHLQTLSMCPRYIFAAVLAHNALEEDYQRVSTFQQLLNAMHAGLEPKLLCRLLYPELTSYSDPDTLCPEIPLQLSAKSLETNGPYFLLDAYTDIYVYYRGGEGGGGDQIPPAPTSFVPASASSSSNAPPVPTLALPLLDDVKTAKTPPYPRRSVSEELLLVSPREEQHPQPLPSSDAQGQEHPQRALSAELDLLSPRSRQHYLDDQSSSSVDRKNHSSNSIFPLPKNSMIQKFVDQCYAERFPTPTIHYILGANATLALQQLHNHLIEDNTNNLTFSTFARELCTRVIRILRPSS